MEVRLKRVYDPESPGDGFRVLVDKLWPRGIRKEAFHYDLWAKRILSLIHISEPTRRS